jgi:hypothetical protein
MVVSYKRGRKDADLETPVSTQRYVPRPQIVEHSDLRGQDGPTVLLVAFLVNPRSHPLQVVSRDRHGSDNYEIIPIAVSAGMPGCQITGREHIVVKQEDHISSGSCNTPL